MSLLIVCQFGPCIHTEDTIEWGYPAQRLSSVYRGTSKGTPGCQFNYSNIKERHTNLLLAPYLTAKIAYNYSFLLFQCTRNNLGTEPRRLLSMKKLYVPNTTRPCDLRLAQELSTNIQATTLSEHIQMTL